MIKSTIKIMIRPQKILFMGDNELLSVVSVMRITLNLSKIPLGGAGGASC